MRQGFNETRRLIRADLERRCTYENKAATASTRAKLLLHPGGATVALFRWQTFFDTNGLRPLGGVLRWLNLVMFTSTYSSSAQVAGGLLVLHATANCIDAGVVIGPRCTMFGQVAIVRSPFFEASSASGQPAPVIESDVVFGVGACAQGAIHIGAGCAIGMNTLVDVSALAGSSLLGVPARVTGRAASAST